MLEYDILRPSSGARAKCQEIDLPVAERQGKIASALAHRVVAGNSAVSQKQFSFADPAGSRMF